MSRQANAKNIIVGAGALYLGPAGKENAGISAASGSATFQNPANVSTSASGASWEYAGYTTDGMTMSIEPDYGEVAVDQLLDVARIFKQGQKVTVATSLAEGTLENLYLAIGAGLGDLHYNASASVNGAFGDNHGSASTITAKEAAVIGSVPQQIAAALDLSGGALGQAPLERSICIVGQAPTAFGGTNALNSERVYIGYRAVAMDTVGVSVKRDEATFFPVSFRLLPSTNFTGANNSALYGRIVDRVWP